MIIALDYDDTFTKDKDLWAMFVDRAKKNGHEVVFVTFRKDAYNGERVSMGRDPNNDDIRQDAEELGIPVVFTGYQQKKHHFQADVWIDDMPQVIVSYEELCSMKIGCEVNGDTKHVRGY